MGNGGNTLQRLRIEGNRIDDLVKYLSCTSPNSEEICKASILKEIDDKRVGFFVLEGFYFRIQRTVSCSIFLYQTSPTSCEITVVGSGGATAVGITWGAHGDMEKKVSKTILDYAKQLEMKTDSFQRALSERKMQENDVSLS